MKKFYAMDTDGDGTVTKRELLTLLTERIGEIEAVKEVDGIF